MNDKAKDMETFHPNEYYSFHSDIRSLPSLAPARKGQNVQVYGVGKILSKFQDRELSAMLDNFRSVNYLVFAASEDLENIIEGSALVKQNYPNLKVKKGAFITYASLQ